MPGSTGCLQDTAGDAVLTQAPDVHWSVVQRLASVQALPSGRFAPAQRPAEQASPDVHWLPSLQALPSGSTVQLDEQQSPSAWLPSSHSSP